MNILAKWARNISNHLCWSIDTCNGNGKELAERFTSVIHHTVNKHRFPNNKFYKKCEHPKYTREETKSKEWLVIGSAPHEKLIKIILQASLVKDLEHMAEQINTTLLEVFHAEKIRYLPKSVYYRMEKMILGTQIAILDHHYNIDREQKQSLDDEGMPKLLYSIAYSKANKRRVAKIIKEKKVTSIYTIS